MKNYKYNKIVKLNSKYIKMKKNYKHMNKFFKSIHLLNLVNK